LEAFSALCILPMTIPMTKTETEKPKAQRPNNVQNGTFTSTSHFWPLFSLGSPRRLTSKAWGLGHVLVTYACIHGFNPGQNALGGTTGGLPTRKWTLIRGRSKICIPKKKVPGTPIVTLGFSLIIGMVIGGLFGAAHSSNDHSNDQIRNRKAENTAPKQRPKWDFYVHFPFLDPLSASLSTGPCLQGLGLGPCVLHVCVGVWLQPRSKGSRGEPGGPPDT